MAMKSRKRMYRRSSMFFKTRTMNIIRRARTEAAKGKSRACRTCVASLICNAETPPASVWRCKHCNKRVAMWGGALWDHPTDCERSVAGVNRCPHTLVMVRVCENCREKLENEKIARSEAREAYPFCLN